MGLLKWLGCGGSRQNSKMGCQMVSSCFAANIAVGPRCLTEAFSA